MHTHTAHIAIDASVSYYERFDIFMKATAEHTRARAHAHIGASEHTHARARTHTRARAHTTGDETGELDKRKSTDAVRFFANYIESSNG